MKRNIARRRHAVRMAVLLLLLPLASACGSAGPGKQESAALDPPPSGVEEAMLAQSQKTKITVGALEEGKPEDAVTVYLLDAGGYLAPMTMRSGAEGPLSAAETAMTALTWLTRDESRSSELPAGFSAVLPEGTRVERVQLDTDAKTAFVDFASPLPVETANRERKMIEGIVWTLTELPGIDKVRLTVGGKPIRMLPSSGLPVDEVLTRGFGINVERAQGVQLSHSMAVTLYFSAHSADGDGYFVPVTRLIDRNPDRLGAALKEWAYGPLDSKELQSAALPGVTIDKWAVASAVAGVSLRQDGWNPQTPVPAAMMESLVLTVSESAGVPQVKLSMNGNDSFIDTDSNSYDRPVTRPAAVNVWKS